MSNKTMDCNGEYYEKCNVEPHCFWCKHLILDGCGSWCEIRRAGIPCEDYIFNKDRYETAKKTQS